MGIPIMFATTEEIYNDVITSIVKLIVHNPVGKLV